jgi:hypothetical protein
MANAQASSKYTVYVTFDGSSTTVNLDLSKQINADNLAPASATISAVASVALIGSIGALPSSTSVVSATEIEFTFSSPPGGTVGYTVQVAF